MATTNATLTLSSADLTGDNLSLSTTTSLSQAGTNTGLSQTTGLTRRTYAAAITTQEAILTASEYANDEAHKVYVKNLSTTASEFVTIFIGAVEVGRLYAGDFMFLPWSAVASADIDIKTSAANMSIEFMVFVENFA